MALVPPADSAEHLLFPPHPPGVLPFFTTRRGGVSEGDYHTMNLGAHVHDRPEAVERNRQRLTEWLGVAPEALCVADQVHGATPRIVTRPLSPPLPAADALVTGQPGLVVAVLTADCVPILLCDPTRPVIAAVHAGWRGALLGVLASTLDAMIALGGRAEETFAWIGPCIRQRNYQVGHDLREQFLAMPGQENGPFFAARSESGRFDFDLAGYSRSRLCAHHLAPERIYDTTLCTFERGDLFFSHRRAVVARGSQAHTGRQLSGIFLVP